MRMFWFIGCRSVSSLAMWQYLVTARRQFIITRHVNSAAVYTGDGGIQTLPFKSTKKLKIRLFLILCMESIDNWQLILIENTLNFWPLGQCMPSDYYLCSLPITKFGVDSSSRFPHRAWTNRQTNKQTYASKRPTHAGGYTAGIDNSIM